MSSYLRLLNQVPSFPLFLFVPLSLYLLPPTLTILHVQAKKLTSKILQAKIMFSQKNLRSPKACRSSGTIKHFFPSWLVTHLFLQPTGSLNFPPAILMLRSERNWLRNHIVQPLWRTVQRFLKKLQTELPYDLGIHTEETRIERDTCTPMFIAALFIIARTWKQPRCPSADEWIRKLWIHNGVLLSH